MYLAALSPARAADPVNQLAAIDLPLAGLRVPMTLPSGATWSVSSRWDAGRHEDTLVVTRPDGAGDVTDTYVIEVSGRTARDCPLVDPFPIEIGGETWITGTAAGSSGALPAAGGDGDGALICRPFLDARAVVRISPAPAWDAPGSERHVVVLRPLLDAIRNRTLIPGLPEARVLPPPEHPLEPEQVLPTVGLVLQRPSIPERWQVAEVRRPEGPPGPASADRDFDALIRVVPTFPEVQIAVRRHALAEVRGCARLARHQLGNYWQARDTPPPAGWSGVLGKRIGRFESFAVCREQDGALLDVRVAARPAVSIAAVMPMLDALARARAILLPPPSTVPDSASRAVLVRAAALALGLDFPGTIARSSDVTPRSTLAPFGALDLGLSFTTRNGLALAASLALGADGHGALVGASIETGVALALDDELTFVLALALGDRREALFENRALSLVMDMRAGFHVPHTFGWSLRMVPLHLASRAPAITGLPLEIGWTGVFPSGLLIGADLRWVSSPLEATAAWPSEGLGFGLRIGWGDVSR